MVYKYIWNRFIVHHHCVMRSSFQISIYIMKVEWCDSCIIFQLHFDWFFFSLMCCLRYFVIASCTAFQGGIAYFTFIAWKKGQCMSGIKNLNEILLGLLESTIRNKNTWERILFEQRHGIKKKIHWHKISGIWAQSDWQPKKRRKTHPHPVLSSFKPF